MLDSGEERCQASSELDAPDFSGIPQRAKIRAAQNISKSRSKATVVSRYLMRAYIVTRRSGFVSRFW